MSSEDPSAVLHLARLATQAQPQAQAQAQAAQRQARPVAAAPAHQKLLVVIMRFLQLWVSLGFSLLCLGCGEDVVSMY